MVLKDCVESLHGEAESHLLKLRHCLEELVGSPETLRIFMNHFENGLLTRLKNLCLLFLQWYPSKDQNILQMSHCVDKLWSLCMDSLKHISSDCAASLLVQNIHEVIISLENFRHFLGEILLQYRSDENVVFFLLRHHAEFDDCYGKNFVVDLLKKMYPDGVNEVERFLSKRYALRGFQHLLPTISSKMTFLPNR